MVIRTVLWWGLRVLQALCVAMSNEKKTIVWRVQREYVTCCSGTHRLMCCWSTVTRSAKALLSATPPDARWAKWASVLASATENRTTTDIEADSCWQNFIYRSREKKRSHIQSHLYNHVWSERQGRRQGANRNKRAIKLNRSVYLQDEGNKLQYVNVNKGKREINYFLDDFRNYVVADICC